MFNRETERVSYWRFIHTWQRSICLNHSNSNPALNKNPHSAFNSTSFRACTESQPILVSIRFGFSMNLHNIRIYAPRSVPKICPPPSMDIFMCAFGCSVCAMCSRHFRVHSQWPGNNNTKVRAAHTEDSIVTTLTANITWHFGHTMPDVDSPCMPLSSSLSHTSLCVVFWLSIRLWMWWGRWAGRRSGDWIVNGNSIVSISNTRTFVWMCMGNEFPMEVILVQMLVYALRMWMCKNKRIDKRADIGQWCYYAIIIAWKLYPAVSAIVLNVLRWHYRCGVEQKPTLQPNVCHTANGYRE